MRFAYPQVLWLLLLLPVLGALAWQRLRAGRRTLDESLSEKMAARLTAHLNPRAAGLATVLLLLAALLVVVGAARPQRGSQYVTATRKGIDLIIALDVSESMLAEDLKPNRLLRARHEIASILDRLEGDRVGLVAFAGAAFVQCPLTLDYAAARMFLEYMGPDLIPEPGTNLADALEVSARAFESEGDGFRALVLISDGEDHLGEVEAAAREARKMRVRVFTVGIGSESGEPIPIRNAEGEVDGYKKDRDGKIVMTRLNELPLREIADQTGGLYVRAGGTLGLERILDEIAGMEKKELSGGIRMLYEDRYSYFVWPALVLLFAAWWIPGRRRGSVAVGRPSGLGRAGAKVVLLALSWTLAGAGAVAGAQSAHAPPVPSGQMGGPGQGAGGPQMPPGSPQEEMPPQEQWNDWLAENEVFRSDHPRDPRPFYNLGNLFHLKGELEDATGLYELALGKTGEELGARAAYNKGNTLYKLGRLPEARAAYAHSLAQDPGFEDAKINLELTQRLLDQMQAQRDSSQQQEGGENQQQSEDQQNEQQQEQNEDQSSEQQQEQNEQDQQGEQNQQDQQQPEDQEGDEQQQPEEEPSEQEDQQQPQDGEPNPTEADSTQTLSETQLLQILKALEGSEKELLERRFQARSRNEKVEKDW